MLIATHSKSTSIYIYRSQYSAIKNNIFVIIKDHKWPKYPLIKATGWINYSIYTVKDYKSFSKKRNERRNIYTLCVIWDSVSEKQLIKWKTKYAMFCKHVRDIHVCLYFLKETVNGRINQKLTIKQITTKGEKRLRIKMDSKNAQYKL